MEIRTFSITCIFLLNVLKKEVTKSIYLSKKGMMRQTSQLLKTIGRRVGA